MQSSITRAGLTFQVIAGMHDAIPGIALQDNKRPGRLGFSIPRTGLGPATGPAPAKSAKLPKPSWQPDMLYFLTAPEPAPTSAFTFRAPLSSLNH